MRPENRDKFCYLFLQQVLSSWFLREILVWFRDEKDVTFLFSCRLDAKYALLDERGQTTAIFDYRS